MFGERINPNVKTLASTESKDNLIPSTNSRQSNNGLSNEDLIGNALNQEAKLTTKSVPTTIITTTTATKETEENDKLEEVDLKAKNSVENQNLQLNSGMVCKVLDSFFNNNYNLYTFFLILI